MVRQVCHFSGSAQGVGFRYTVKSLSTGFRVQGFVRNLRDGRVELVMEGTEDQLNGLLAEVRRQMAGHIDSVELETLPATGEFTGFSIRH